MLVIRNDQLRAFQSERQHMLESGLLERFAHDYPDDFASLGKEGAQALAVETLRSATSRHIQTEAAIYNLLRLFIEFGPGLELAPYRRWANDLLDHPTLPGPVKVNLVTKRIFELTQGRRMILHREED